MSAPEQFLMDIVSKSNKDELIYKSDELFVMFNTWKLDNHVNFETNKLKFCVKLSTLKIQGFTNKKCKDANYRVFDIPTMKKYFKIDEYLF
jgi:hypothetical protein